MRPVLCLILLLVIFPCVIFSVLHEFCEDLFDDSDCGTPPMSVLYYYKPGSRCEVRTWRGCPTLNKFPDYFSCTHFCVGRLSGEQAEIPALLFSAEEAKKENTIKIAKDENIWKEDINALDVEEIEEIDNILNDVVNVLLKPRIEKLSEKQSNKNKQKQDQVTEPDNEASDVVEETTVDLEMLLGQLKPLSSSEIRANLNSEEEVITAWG